jgi:hypothetical protein
MATNVRNPIWVQALSAPGAHAFALLFAIDSVTRATLATIVPLQLFAVSGSPALLSVIYFAISVTGLLANFLIAPLTGLISRRYTFTFGCLCQLAAPLLIWHESLTLVTLGMLLRMFGSATITICLNLYILDHIRGRALNAMEPLRLTFVAGAWTLCPWLGVFLWGRVEWLPFVIAGSCAVVLAGYFWYLRVGDNPVIRKARSTPANPFAAVLPFVRQRRLLLTWLIAFGRSTWWVAFFVYLPVFALQSGFSRETGALMVSAGNALLFLTPVLARFGHRYGLRGSLVRAFIVAGAITVAAGAFAWVDPRIACALLLVCTLPVVVLDIFGNVPFLRMVKPSERIPMTGVFATYRDGSEIAAPALAAIVLTVLPLPAFFVVLGLLVGTVSMVAASLPRRL